MALLTVATPIGVGVVSLRPNESFMIARNLIAPIVPAAVLVGWLLTSLRRRAAVPAVTAFLVVLGIGTVIGLRSTSRRTPYRDVAHFIDAHSRTGDPVIQQFIVPTNGPLRTVIAINLSHPREIFTTPAGAAEAWQLARRRGTDVFLSQDLPGYFRSIQHLPPRAGPGDEFVRIAEHRYLGLSTVIVAQYRYHGSRPGRSGVQRVRFDPYSAASPRSVSVSRVSAGRSVANPTLIVAFGRARWTSVSM
jgi:hypothetical protein